MAPPEEVAVALRTRLQIERRYRDLAMFNVAIDSKLRGCDLVRLRVADVAAGGTARTRSSIIQQKTARSVPFELTATTRAAISTWLAVRRSGCGDWLWPSRNRAGEHITTRQYGRLVDSWMTLIGLDASTYGTRSLRRTKVSLIYKRTATCAPANSYLATPHWRAPFNFSVLKSTTRSRCRSRKISKTLAGGRY